tara:strand:- start:1799 stop:2287 length:489 start_codon:yes stop_codon:yes gene_type:complete
MIRLITQSRVAELSFSNGETFEDGLILDAIIEAAQLRWIRPMLGNDLWDTLEASGGVYSAANQTLVDRLETPLAFFIKYEIVPDMSINQTSAGLQVLNTEYSTSATDKQRGQIQDQALEHAKSILAEVTRWIEKTTVITDYPDYATSTNVTNDVSRKGGILF